MTAIASPELLAGMLAEMQAYTGAMQARLSSRARIHLDELAQLAENCRVFLDSARMLELAEVADRIEPVYGLLKAAADGGRTLKAAEKNSLSQRIESLADCLNHLANAEKAIAAPTSPSLPKLPPEIMQIFAAEAADHCANMHRHLENLRHSPENTEELSGLRRAIHTLKGASASVGLDRIARLAHRMEDAAQLHIDLQEPLSTETHAFMVQGADILEALLTGQEDQLADLARIEAYYENLPGAIQKAAPATPAAPPDPASGIALTQAPSVAPSSEMLRIPQARVDRLLNQLGEVVINRSSLESSIGVMHNILHELDLSTRRLSIAATSIDSHIEQTHMGRLASTGEEFDPLEMERYTALYQLARELEEVATDTSDINTQMRYLADEIEGTVLRERRLTHDLQDSLMQARMVSFAEVETRLRRAVQRTANDLGKEAELVVDGISTLLDKSIRDALIEPLLHLLRNAVDHGLELPDERTRASKSPGGVVRLSVMRQRGRITLHIADDGRGIDVDRIRAKAVQAGFISADEALDENRLLDILCMENFSSRQEVTETSGRGIGLNIVRQAVRELKGFIRLRNQPGVGVTFSLSVPVSLAITRALYVRSGSHMLAAPLEQVESVFRIDPSELRQIRGEGLYRHSGRMLGVLDLHHFIGGEYPEASKQRYGLLIEAGGSSQIILVDGLAGIHEVVVKSLGTHLRRVHGISGATIGGNGQVILILDVLELAGLAEAVPAQQSQSHRIAFPALPARNRRVLVVDDSISIRKVLSNFLDQSGWVSLAARDGLDALEKLSGFEPDVVLLDIEMPRMNGYELLSEMRSHEALRHIAVVFLTSRSGPKHRERAELLGADGFLVKPYREDELLNALESAIRDRAEVVAG